MATKKRLTYTHDEVQALLDAIIETIRVNGTALTVSDRAVDLSIPTKLSDLGEFLLEFNEGTIDFTNGAIVLSDPDRESIVTITNDEISLWRTGDNQFRLQSGGAFYVGGRTYFLPSDGQGAIALRSDIKLSIYSRTFSNDEFTDIQTINNLYPSVLTDVRAGKTVFIKLTDMHGTVAYFRVSSVFEADGYLNAIADIDGSLFNMTLNSIGGCSITEMILDADNIAYIGDEEAQGSLSPDFDPYTDTVWNKTQALSAAQKETVRQNIGIDMSKVITTDDEVIFDCGTSTT